MRLSELIFPKQNPRRSGMHGTDEEVTKGDVIRCVKDLHSQGVHPGDILKHVTQKYGNDFFKVAEQCLSEAISATPQNTDDLDKLKELFKQHLPVELATDALDDLIVDDALSDDFAHAEPGSDARPIIRNWIELNMPSMITPDEELMGAGQGIFSPLHGYNDEEAVVNPGNVSW